MDFLLNSNELDWGIYSLLIPEIIRDY